MQKLIKIISILYICFLIKSQAYSQCWNSEFTITTDWRDPSSANTWDWTQQQFNDVYIVDPNAAASDPVLPATIQSPFFNPGSGPFNNVNLTPFVNAYANSGINGIDFAPEDGWELLAKSFGQCCIQATAVNEPFFALYNRRTGTIRLFLLKVYSSATPYNGVSVKISFNGSRQSALLQHAYPICKAVAEFKRDIVMQSPNYYTDDAYYWYFADFPAAYDPCTCNYPSQIKIAYDQISTADIKLEGDITGTIRQVISPTQNVNTADGEKTITDFASAVGNEIKAINKSYATWDGLKKEVDKFIDNNKADIKLNMTTELDALKNYTKFLPYIGTLVGIFDFFMGGGKKTKEQQKPTPMAFETNQHLTITGSMVTTSVASNNIFWNPGSNVSALTAKPIYDNILGVFNILETPVVEYVDYEINSTVLTSEPHIRQYKLSGPLKYVLNPAAHLKVKSIDAAYIIKYKPFLNPVGPSQVPYLEILGPSVGTVQLPYPHPVEWGTPSTTYYNMPLEQRMNRAGFEFEQFPVTWPLNQDNAILRTPYVPISCFDKESFFLYHPTSGATPEVIQIKIVVRMESLDDPEAQDILFICTYEPSFAGSIGGIYDIAFDSNVPAPYPLWNVAYPTQLRNAPGGAIGPIFPYSPWKDIPMNLKFENTTISSDVVAMNTITIGDNVTIIGGVTIKAGKSIDILSTNTIDPTVVLMIGYDEVTCGNDPINNHNSNAEIAAFCNTGSAYDAHSLRRGEHTLADDVIFSVKVYPNPSRSIFNIEPANSEVEYHLTVFNSIGEKIIESNQVGLHKLNLSAITKGIYIIRVETRDNGHFIEKLVLH